jgi:hypothetical protein
VFGLILFATTVGSEIECSYRPPKPLDIKNSVPVIAPSFPPGAERAIPVTDSGYWQNRKAYDAASDKLWKSITVAKQSICKARQSKNETDWTNAYRDAVKALSDHRDVGLAQGKLRRYQLRLPSSHPEKARLGRAIWDLNDYESSQSAILALIRAVLLERPPARQSG